MNSDVQPHALNLFRAPVAGPLIAEQAHEALGNELEAALLPLRVFCETEEAKDWLTPWQADRVDDVRQMLAGFGRYDAQFEELLDAYRLALATAHAQLAERVPPLEMALVQPSPDWHSITLRLLNRLYQYEPGVALACQRLAVQPQARLNWEAAAFRLLDRLHRHEPPTPPTPLMDRVRRFLDSPGMVARAALPLAERQALASVTSATLDTLSQ